MRIVCLTFGMAEISKDEIGKKLSKLAKVHNWFPLRRIAVVIRSRVTVSRYAEVKRKMDSVRGSPDFPRYYFTEETQSLTAGA